MLLHINEKFLMKKLRSSLLSDFSFVVNLFISVNFYVLVNDDFSFMQILFISIWVLLFFFLAK